MTTSKCICYYFKLPISVVVRSKAQVWDRLMLGLRVRNTLKAHVFYVMLRVQRPLRRADHTVRGVLSGACVRVRARVRVALRVIQKPLHCGGVGQIWTAVPHNQLCKILAHMLKFCLLYLYICIKAQLPGARDFAHFIHAPCVCMNNTLTIFRNTFCCSISLSSLPCKGGRCILCRLQSKFQNILKVNFRLQNI